MSNFSIGGGGDGGGKLPKARALPVGTPTRIVEVSVQESTFKQTIRSGPNAGKEIPRMQLKVVYETLESGTTLAYTSSAPGRAPVEEPAFQFAAGDRFVQYLGGVYPKDAGGVTLTQAGSAYAFIDALQSLDIKPSGSLEDYQGLEVTIDHLKGRGPAGPYVQAMPGALLAKAAPATPQSAPPAASTEGAPTNAFLSLSEANQSLILDTVKDGTTLTATDLVEAAIATDTAHAEAIIASIPKADNPLKRA